MTTYDQLEIIHPDGQVEFYALDPGRGITNIGRHPDNDVMLDDPAVDSVHAMLDHRQQPYQLVVFSRTRAVVLDGERLTHNMSRALQNWSTMTVGNHTLIFIAGSPGNGAAAIAPRSQQEGGAPGGSGSGAVSRARPFQAAPAAPPQTRPESFRPPNGQQRVPAPVPITPMVNGRFNSRPPDHSDDWIVTELTENTWQIDVEQQAIGQLVITNGGPLVAHFQITARGIDPEWIEINPTGVELNDGDSRTVTLTLTAHRSPASRAKAHHFVIEVTSHDYPDRFSAHGATLIINPYFQFAVSEVSPKRQTIPWRNHVGRATISVTNLGNSNAALRLEGSDEEHACYYEFDVPGEAVSLVHQAEFQLQPEETLQIPIRIIPFSRRLIGLSKRLFRYTVTVSQVTEQQFSRSTMAELRSAPLIGPWLILLMSLILIILLLILVRPRLYMFMFTEGGQVAAISNNTPVAMQWRASFFTTDLAMNPVPDNLPQPMPRQGTVEAFPTGNASYELTGNNLLSRFAPSIFPAPVGTVQVRVNPVAPLVNFSVQPGEILGEGEVTLNWSVDRADKIELLRQIGDNQPEFISDVSGQPAGSLVVTPEPNQARIIYILRASNAYVSTPTPAAGAVIIQTPTPTLPPTPAVQFFAANPLLINAGEASTLSWQVSNTEQATLVYPDGSQFPVGPQGSQMVQPLTPGNYILNPGSGGEPRSVFIEVIPATATPTATPVPEAPVINIFEASDDELIQGKATPEDDEKDIIVQWKVLGTVTNVELNAGPDLGTYSNLNPEGQLQLRVTANTVLVLTAFNQDKTASKSLQVSVVEATATPEPPTPPPPPTPTPLPAKVFFFKVVPDNAADSDKVTFLGNDRYRVLVGTDIKLQWETSTDADSVTISEINQSFGPGPSEYLFVNYSQRSAPSGDNPKTYTLIVKKEDADEAQASIQVEIIPRPAPQPPTNVNGNVNGQDNTITWSWSKVDPLEEILGFKIYRSDVPPGNNFSFSQEILDPNARTWTDAGGGCGKVYEVATLYEDINLDQQETRRSSTSWASNPCP